MILDIVIFESVISRGRANLDETLIEVQENYTRVANLERDWQGKRLMYGRVLHMRREECTLLHLWLNRSRASQYIEINCKAEDYKLSDLKVLGEVLGEGLERKSNHVHN